MQSAIGVIIYLIIFSLMIKGIINLMSKKRSSQNTKIKLLEEQNELLKQLVNQQNKR